MRMPLWLRRWLTEGVDSSLRVTGYRYTTPRVYDYQKARAGYLRSRRQTATGRPIGRAHEDVVPLRRAK